MQCSRSVQEERSDVSPQAAYVIGVVSASQRASHSGLAAVGAAALAQHAGKSGAGAGSLCARAAHPVGLAVAACAAVFCTEPLLVERPEHVEPPGRSDRRGHLRTRVAQATAAVVGLAAVALWGTVGGAAPVVERANQPTHEAQWMGPRSNARVPKASCGGCIAPTTY